MLIQNVNTGNTAQTVQTAKSTNNGSPKVVPAVKTQPVAPAEQENGTTQLSVNELKSAVNVINNALQQLNHALEFSVDNETKRPVVKMVDTETGELIRQIPSEETLAISRSIDQFQLQNGTLLKQKA